MTAYGNFQVFRDDMWAKRTVFDEAPPGFWEGLRIVGPGLGIFDRPIIGRLIGAGLSVYQPFYPSAMVVERTAFLNAGGWDELEPAEDYSTFLRAAERPVGIVQYPLVGYRRHSSNYSAVSYNWNDGLRHTVNRRVIVQARILEHVLATRPALRPHREAFLAKIGELADFAFDRGDFVAYHQIYPMLPPSHHTLRRKLKSWISRLPDSAAQGAAKFAKSVQTRFR